MTAIHPSRTDVRSEGLSLATWDSGGAGPTLVFVHGFPDTHIVWDLVVDRLAGRFRCVAYDVRGAGASDAPDEPADYALSRLRTDLVAVMDEVSPHAPVHLVGHDWGSVQCWDAVVRASSDPRLAGRIASYTSISGPCLQHMAAFARASRRGGWDRRREGANQLVRSWYIYAFHVPRVPEWLLRHYFRGIFPMHRTTSHFADTVAEDAVNGLNLYRANAFHPQPVPGGPRTDVPVQLIVPLHDTFVTPALSRDVHRFVADLTRVDIDAGHWAPRSRPNEVASHISDFVTARRSDTTQSGRTEP